MGKDYDCSKKDNCCYYFENKNLQNKICDSCIYRKIKDNKGIENKDLEINKSELNTMQILDEVGMTDKKNLYTFNDRTSETTFFKCDFSNISETLKEYSKKEAKDSTKYSKIKPVWSNNFVFVVYLCLVIISGIIYFFISSNNSKYVYIDESIIKKNTNLNSSYTNKIIKSPSPDIDLEKSEGAIVSEKEKNTSIIDTTSIVKNTHEPTTPINEKISSLYEVKYSLRSVWDNYAIIDIIIKNNSDEKLNEWVLSWEFEANQKIEEMWNATFEQDGNAVSVKGMDYNFSIPADDAVNFGFRINYNTTNPVPKTCVLNGVICKVN